MRCPFVLQTSEKLDQNMELLGRVLGLWEDVLSISEDVESWTNIATAELNQSLSNFTDSRKVSARLAELQVWPLSAGAQRGGASHPGCVSWFRRR